VVLFVVSVLTFVIVNVLPGDVASAMLGDLGSPEQVIAMPVTRSSVSAVV
jgi:ABC-type dipeptide/oligopeptide/nickel transport system permease component